MPDPLDPRLLATFRAVAAAGRISAAARGLHLSQPAVTAQVRRLEEQCGVPLLTRSARGVTLTAPGRALLGYADRLAALLDDAAAALTTAPVARALVLGASTTIAAAVLPRLLASFARGGELAIRIEVGNTEQILERVRAGALPLALVEGLRRAPRVRLEPFLEDELVALVASDAPAPLLRLRHATDLRTAPIIWREPGSGTRAVVERALRHAIGKRAPLTRDVEMGSTEAVKGAALAGLGVAFLSRWTVRTELALGTLRALPLRDLAIARGFSWALPAGGATGVAREFLRAATHAAPTLAP